MSPPFRIGGPGTCLSRVVESFLSWTLALSCLLLSGYHYLVSTERVSVLFRRPLQGDNKQTLLPSSWLMLPLTTTSRSEMDRLTPMQRLNQLQQYLESKTNKKEWTNNELVSLLRESCTGRRLATLAIIRGPTNDHDDTTTQKHETPSQTPLGQQLIHIWPALLVLPPSTLPSLQSYQYEISLIMPAFQESGEQVRNKLQTALESCQNPKSIQVIVVDAGECNELQHHVESVQGWGSLTIEKYTDGGGRGPCLNFGASLATGQVYTFCHSDTTLPVNWDSKILTTLFDNDNTTTRANVRANSCAFQFGIDTSTQGLDGGPLPPGIKAVETTANIRTRLYSLPYGDQVLSLPATIFNYIGGFPDQCLMEDYELVSLLRKRAAFGRHQQSEQLSIISGPPALCSPRRWQKFGVLYVTYMNSKFVYLYKNAGLTPDQLFEQYYYKQPPPKRTSILSPWEVELNNDISE